MEHLTATQIQALVSGELTGADLAAAKDHLASCEQCALHHAEAQELWGVLAGLGTEEGAEVDGNESSTSVWPAVRRRTFGANSRDDWFFGGRLATQASLAATALAAGLFVGGVLPGASDLEPGMRESSLSETGTEAVADDGFQSDWFSGTVWADGTTALEAAWLAYEQDEGVDLTVESPSGRNGQ